MNERTADPITEAPLSETAIIDIIGDELHRVGLQADFTDDCAHLRETTALVTTDVMVEGVHFDLDLDTPAQAGAQAAVMLHLATQVRPDIPVVFVDTGYLFPETYEFA